MSATYDTNNHQVGLTYDANGNQLWYAGHDMQYAWNVENRLASETSTSGPQTYFSYDPWGRRVMEDVNANPSAGYTNESWNFYFYDIVGHKVLTYNTNYGYTGSGGHLNMYFGKKLIQLNGNPVVTDRLGSVRSVNNYGWNMMRYYPFGEEQTTTSDGIEKFATYFRDMEGQDYARARYYNSGTARFWSPDPGGIRTANPGNPFTWNRYAYAGGDPVNRFDPSGMDPPPPPGCGDQTVCTGGDDCDDDDVCIDSSQGTSGSSTPTTPTVGPVFIVNSQPACQNGQVLVGASGSAQCTTLTITSTVPVVLPNIPVDPPAPITIPDPTPIITTVAGTITDILSGLPGVILGIFAFSTPTAGNDTLSGTTGHSPECEEQWDWAINYCRQHPSARQLPGGGVASVYACAKGYVSEACGGNPIQH